MSTPNHLRYGYTSSPIKQCDVHSCLVEIAGCVSTLAPTEHLRLHLMAAISVNSLYRTHLTTLTTALPRTSAAMRPRRTLYITSYMSLHTSPQLVPMNPTRLDGSPALTGHYMVDIITTHDDQDPSEHFVVSGRQTITLTGYRGLQPDGILVTASAPLLRVPLEALAQHNEQHGVTAVAESLIPLAPSPPASNVTPDTSGGPSTELLHRLDGDQRG